MRALLIVALAVAAPAASAAADPIIGERAPSLPGQSVDAGVVIVDFFATWCEPCHAAMATLDELARKSPGVRLVVVDVGEPRARVDAFFADHPLPPGAAVVLDTTGENARRWGQHRFPTTFLVGDGVIRHINRGYGPGYAARLRAWLSRMVEANP